MTTDEIHDKIQESTGHDILPICEDINNAVARVENQIVSIRQCLKQMEDVLDAHSKELKSLSRTVRSLCDIHP